MSVFRGRERDDSKETGEEASGEGEYDSEKFSLLSLAIGKQAEC